MLRGMLSSINLQNKSWAVKQIFLKGRVDKVVFFHFVLTLVLGLSFASSSAANFSNAVDFRDIDLSQEVLPPYIGAINGEAFILKQKAQGIEVVPLKTSFPVFKAFGLSPDKSRLLYSPLSGGILPGRTLCLSHLATSL